MAITLGSIASRRLAGGALRRALTATIALATAAGTALTGAAPANAAAASNVQRIFGSTRIQTAIATSVDEYPGAESAKAVVLARSDDFPDALAGAPLAAHVGAPLLLTAPSKLYAAVATEIERVAPRGSTVYILGGTAAISADVEKQVQAFGDVTKRIYGADRYETAVAIAHQLGDPTTIFEATGLDFPDALAAGPAAIVAGGAVLLTNGASQAKATAAYLQAHPGGVRYALGGPAAAADPGAVAFIGKDRYETAAEVADQFFPSPTAVGATTGLSFPDAVAAGPYLAARGAPLLLVPPAGNLPESVAVEMLADSDSLHNAIVFGGTAAVSAGVATQLGRFAGLTATAAAATASPQWTGRYGVLREQASGSGTSSTASEFTVVVDGDTGAATTYVKDGGASPAPASYPTRPKLAAMLADPNGIEHAVNAAYGDQFSGYAFPSPDAEFVLTAQKVLEHPLASPTLRAAVYARLATLAIADVSVGAHDSTGRAAIDVSAPIQGSPQFAGDTIHYLFDASTGLALEIKRVDSTGKTLSVATYLSFSTASTAPANPYA